MKFKILLNKILVVFMFGIAVNTVVSCNSGSSTTGASSIPELNQNALNFIFVQSFESNPNYNNLSVKGFNHSLLFGQLLTQMTAYNLSGVFSLAPYSNIVNGYPDMRTIQSIENYALLNGYGINDSLPNNPEIIADMIMNIIGNASTGVNVKGNYVIALPSDLINNILKVLNTNTSSQFSQLYFTYTPITSGNFNQYVVFSIANLANISVNTYNDNLVPSDNYPQLNIPTGAQCLESPVTIQSSGTPPASINTNETIYFVRHVEAHPANYFDNGNYICQGQWRAIGAPPVLLNKMGNTLPDVVYSSDPSEIYDYESFPFTYVRPALTINPFTVKYNMPMNLVESSEAEWSEPESIAKFFFTGGKFNNKTILVAWEHGNIEETINYLINNIYNLGKSVPNFAYDDYDTIWKVQINAQGQLIFSNDCEGIPTAQLPMSCPNF